MSQAAILTGDLIGSTEAGRDATGAALDLIERIAVQNGAQRFTRFRGDGWHCATTLALGPRLALRLIAGLVAAGGVQSRIAIGLGRVESWGAGELLSQAAGPALTASGRALDAMAPDQVLALASAFPDPLGQMNPRDQALARLWEALARRWSPEQAEALGPALEGQRQTVIAARLGITKQAVSLRLKAASAAALTESLALWEAAMTALPPETP
ncbi:hypothetical protein [Stagnihabitans tardus]|uniref:Uncharacterized protein n=1 Tax=Stagnihabitans tardus TaxID=2699202 RepID=A0AAE5BSI1_9RHOB|nr:hypothetical protein [Stagnihabitans tardus]NBZ87875.1 hypothetical protein [Stagnihabitans tardus]